MAEAESALGISSTYLFLIRSENYNMLSYDNLEKTLKISGMGHSVGLHFSIGEHGSYDNEVQLRTLILNDAILFRGITGLECKVFSFHNPADGDVFQIEVPGLVNVYNDTFFSKIKYISDSNMQWRDGCPCEMFSAGRYEQIQMLVHPMSYADELASDRDVLLFFLKKKLLYLKKMNEIQNRYLRDNVIGLDEIFDYIGRAENR
ncbi:MAG: hypothetical protein H7843_06605 [Nitrospirota bacterium]